MHPRSAFGASPSRGRPLRPGKAGSAMALEWGQIGVAAAIAFKEMKDV
jgi:hypothetical protein